MFFLTSRGIYYHELTESLLLTCVRDSLIIAMVEKQDITIENEILSREFTELEIRRANDYIKKNFYDIAVRYLKTDIEFKIEYLWTSCKKYIEYRLDSSGFAVLLLVSQQYPNSRASKNIAWCNNIWQDYFLRREAIKNNNDVIGEETLESGEVVKTYVTYDFSQHGELPYDFFSAFNNYEDVVE